LVRENRGTGLGRLKVQVYRRQVGCWGWKRNAMKWGNLSNKDRYPTLQEKAGKGPDFVKTYERELFGRGPYTRQKYQLLQKKGAKRFQGLPSRYDKIEL